MAFLRFAIAPDYSEVDFRGQIVIPIFCRVILVSFWSGCIRTVPRRSYPSSPEERQLRRPCWSRSTRYVTLPRSLTRAYRPHQSTSLLSSNTLPLRFWSWLATLLGITRKRVSCPVTYNLPSAMTKSTSLSSFMVLCLTLLVDWANFWAT